MNEGAKKLGQRLVGEGWGAAEGLGDVSFLIYCLRFGKSGRLEAAV